VSGEPGTSGGSRDQRALVARLRAVIEAKDAENAVLRAELEVSREQFRRLELRVAELERRQRQDSTTSGTPPSKDPVGARERRKAERKARQSSERDRNADCKRGGQPGHRGAGLSRDPDPDEREEVPPPAECSRCGSGLDPARRAGTWWSQVRDVRITSFVTEYLLPLLACPCCGEVNAAKVPPWAYPGSISYGPGISTAAVLLQSYGNVPSERTANLIGMLLGVPVSPGFVDLASERLSSRLDDAGFDEAMRAALGEEPVLAADETPVNLLDPAAGLAREDAGAPCYPFSWGPRGVV
jgi:transposase